MMSLRRSLLALVGLNFFSLGRAGPNDVAYDDTDPAWTYHGGWGAISEQNPCTGCNTQPDPQKAHGGTWHDMSKGGSAQFNFVGSGVTVYAICPKNIYRSNFTFLLDNEPDGNFLAPEGGCADYTYDQVIYRKTGLPVRQHVFQVNNWIAPGDEYSTSDLVIDYAVVDPGPAGSSQTTTPNRPTGTTPSTGSTTTTSTPTTTAGGRIIDDVDVSWTYNGPWGQISAANPCAECATQPDPTKAQGTTWHDMSGDGSATLLFSGTSVSVYSICPGPLEGGGAFSSNFAFFLDGKANGTFVGAPGGCTEYQYNQRVYEARNLELGAHNFTIVNVIVETGNKSDLILDYAVVEGGTAAPDGSSTATSPVVTQPGEEGDGVSSIGVSHLFIFIMALLALNLAL